MKKKSNEGKKEKKEAPKRRSFPYCRILFLLVLILSAVLLSFVFELNLDNPIEANYVELPEWQPLEGNLADNKKLESAQYIGHKAIRGPETIVFTSDGTMYTGLMNGQIVRITKSGQIEKIAQIGEETNETLCNDYGSNLHSHATCGRPLGIRLVDKTLYVADAFYGLLSVDITTGAKKTILSASEKRFGSKKLKFTNDLDFDGDIIYFIDSSYVRNVNYAVEEVMAVFPYGRLFSYNTKLDQLDLLLDNLYLPNGLQLMPDKQSILINECSMARILKFHLKGEKKGSKEVFAILPGFGDTIRLSEKNTLFVPFASVRHTKYLSFLDILAPYPYVKTLLSYVINFRRLIFKLPKYGLLAEYDLNGQPIRSWHDSTGKVIECITNAVVYGKKIYLGSYYNDFIGVIDY